MIASHTGTDRVSPKTYGGKKKDSQAHLVFGVQANTHSIDEIHLEHFFFFYPLKSAEIGIFLTCPFPSLTSDPTAQHFLRELKERSFDRQAEQWHARETHTPIHTRWVMRILQGRGPTAPSASVWVLCSKRRADGLGRGVCDTQTNILWFLSVWHSRMAKLRPGWKAVPT